MKIKVQGERKHGKGILDENCIKNSALLWIYMIYINLALRPPRRCSLGKKLIAEEEGGKGKGMIVMYNIYPWKGPEKRQFQAAGLQQGQKESRQQRQVLLIMLLFTTYQEYYIYLQLYRYDTCMKGMRLLNSFQGSTGELIILFLSPPKKKKKKKNQKKG